jgi:hypothetical protein
VPITYRKQLLHYPALSLFLALQACSGGGSSDNSAPSQDPAPPPSAVTTQGKVMLGPVAGATVSVFALNDTDTPLCETQTTGGTDLDSAGRFDIPEGCISPGQEFMIVASGGMDIDADDDGVLDDTATEVKGQVRALLSSDELTRDGWQLNALTESVYQSVKFQLEGADRAEIQSLKESAARRLLSDSIDGDGTIDYSDVLNWNPREHKNKLQDENQITTLLENIHSGDNKPVLPDAAPIEGFDYLNIDAHIHAAHIHENLVLLGVGTNLLIVDATPGKAMRVAAVVPDTGVSDIESKGDVIYVAAGKDGLLSYDISDPEQPQLKSTLDEFTLQLAWYGNSLLATVAKDRHIELLDLVTSQTEAPVVSKRRRFKQDYSHAEAIDVHNGDLYVLASDLSHFQFGIGIYDLSQGGDELSTRSVIDFGMSQGKLPPDQMAFDDNTLFLQTGYIFPDKHIYQYNINNPDNPLVLQDITLPSDSRAISTDTNALYQLNSKQLKVLQLPGLNTVSVLDLPLNYRRVQSNGNYAFLFGNTLGRIKLPPLQRANSAMGRIGFAVLSGADISVRKVGSDSDNCVTKSSEGDLQSAGKIEIELSCVKEHGYYVISVNGGLLLDADGDGAIDDNPATFDGSLNALLSSEEIKAGNWRINEATEMAYRSLAPVLNELNEDSIRQNLDQLAAELLSENIGEKAGLSNEDLLAFVASDHNTFFTPGTETLSNWQDAVLNNTDTSAFIENLSFQATASISIQSSIQEISIAYNGDLLAILDGSLITIFDATTSIGFKKISSINTANASRVALHSHHLYVGHTDGTLDIYSLQTISTPAKIATISDTVYMPASKVHAEMRIHEEKLLLVSTNTQNSEQLDLLIFNISSPETPTLSSRTTLSTGFIVEDMEIHQGHLYIASMRMDNMSMSLYDYVDIYSLENTEQPLIHTAGIHRDDWQDEYGAVYTTALGFRGNFAYLFSPAVFGMNESLFRLYDISNPQSPVLTNTLLKEKEAGAMAISGNGLHRIDTKQLRSYALPTMELISSNSSVTSEYWNSRLEVFDTSAYIIDNKRLTRVNIPEIPAPTELLGRVSLGKVINASVTLHALGNLQSPAICSTQSSDDDSYPNAGKITLSADCVVGGGLFLISSVGGQDIDSDNDGNRDSVTTEVMGSMRAIVSSDELFQGNWSVNPLTEAAYQLLNDRLDTISESEVVALLNTAATAMLKEDLNGDGLLNRSDLLHWHPVAHGAIKTHYEADNLATIQTAIRNDDDRLILANSLSDDISFHLTSNNVSPQLLKATETLLVTAGNQMPTVVYQKTQNRWLPVAELDADAQQIMIENDTLFLVTNDMLKVYELSDPQNAQFAGSFDGIRIRSGTDSFDKLWRANDTVFVLSEIENQYSDFELLALDISDPANISVTSRTALPENRWPIMAAQEGNTFYIVLIQPATLSGFEIQHWDTSDPANPTKYNDSIQVADYEMPPLGNLHIRSESLLATPGASFFNEQWCRLVPLANDGSMQALEECSLPGTSRYQDSNSSIIVSLAAEDNDATIKTLLIDNLNTLDPADRQSIPIPKLDYGDVVTTDTKSYALGRALIELTLP